MRVCDVDLPARVGLLVLMPSLVFFFLLPFGNFAFSNLFFPLSFLLPRKLNDFGKEGQTALVAAMERSNYSLCRVTGVAGAARFLERNQRMLHQRRQRVALGSLLLFQFEWYCVW